MKTLGATDIRLIAPATRHYKEEPPGLEGFADLEEGIEGADVIMSLRLQKERMIAADIPDEQTYFDAFGITTQNLNLLSQMLSLCIPAQVKEETNLAQKLPIVPKLSLYNR